MLVTPLGTVHVCAAPVEANVTVLVSCAPGVAAAVGVDVGAGVGVEVAASASPGPDIANNRLNKRYRMAR
jgi:hypothetical protein